MPDDLAGMLGLRVPAKSEDYTDRPERSAGAIFLERFASRPLHDPFPDTPDQARRANVDVLDALIAEWTRGRTIDEAMVVLDTADVTAGPAYSIKDIAEDPQYQAREMLVDLPDDRLGHLLMPGVVPKLSATPGEVRTAGPDLGEHTLGVLGALLGLDAEALASLRERKVIQPSVSRSRGGVDEVVDWDAARPLGTDPERVGGDVSRGPGEPALLRRHLAKHLVGEMRVRERDDAGRVSPASQSADLIQVFVWRHSSALRQARRTVPRAPPVAGTC